MAYSRPQILAVDIPAEVCERLRESGYALREGTFGTPRGVAPAEAFYRVEMWDALLPGYGESDVFIVDLEAPEPLELEDQPPRITGTTEIFAKAQRGIIDPRPKVMAHFRDGFERVLNHGGCLIALTAARLDAHYVRGTQRHGGVAVERELHWTNWGLTLDLEQLAVRSDYGNDVRPTPAANALGLGTLLTQASFGATAKPGVYQQDRWVTLAKSRFGDDVAGILKVAGDNAGVIVLLPRMVDLAQALRVLLDSVLPRVAPTAFPEHEGHVWRDDPAYELKRISELRTAVAERRRQADDEIARLEGEIERERVDHAWLADLLTATGEELVQAVAEALRWLRATDVRDGDAEARDGGRSDLREDLQVWDRSPLLLIEVKGVHGQPSESETLQINTYLAGRMRELTRTDVKGLTIVNHQRGVPPLRRDNEHTFTADALATAQAQDIGLMTTFDLYRLVRGVLELGWDPAPVLDLLYGIGRIGRVPPGCEPVGRIANYFEEHSVLDLELDEGVELRRGDRIVFDLQGHWSDQVAESLQQNRTGVERAMGRDHVAVLTTLTKAEARPGRRVFIASGPRD